MKARKRRPKTYTDVRAETSALIRQLALDAIGNYHHQRGLCFWCKEPWGRGAEIDHHVPVSRGNRGVIENLRVLCNVCNRAKGDAHPQSYRHRPPVDFTMLHHSMVSDRTTARREIFARQGGRCWWCAQVLYDRCTVITRSLKAICDLCHARYHRLADDDISLLVSQDLL